MITDRKLANAMGGKTTRACDGCLRKRARWFCAADDAFLCHACDSSVHSANQLASRHERVRLQTASSKIGGGGGGIDDSPPAWHQGFTRKARTPRSNKSLLVQQRLLKEEYEDHKSLINISSMPLVPEIGSEDEGNLIEKEDQLLCRVPVFDSFNAELCDILASDEGADGAEVNCHRDDLDNLSGFLSSDMELADFAADVENLLGEEGAELDEEKYNSPKDDTGVLACKEEEDDEENFRFGDFNNQVIKVKDEAETEPIGDCHFGEDFDMSRVSLMDWNFDYDSPVTADDEEEGKDKVVLPHVMEEEAKNNNNGSNKEIKRSLSLLSLNYEAVITAWASKGSPWTTKSRRPELISDECWPNCMDEFPREEKDDHQHSGYGGGMGVQRGGSGGGDGGREARVLRYKEKRRTRLFSKKIRYEVRKLNAEKRPRMKGRFVKRTTTSMSFMGAAAAPFPNCYPPRR